MNDFLVVAGMSGAGRSTAAATLEDLGWFVIDNLPPSLFTRVAELVGSPGSETDRVALVVGRGGGEPMEEVLPVLDSLEADNHRVRVLFLDAPDDVLVRRFEGTRRRHPVAKRGVEESVADERRLLEVVRDRADIIVDTGELNTNQLRQRVQELFGEAGAAGQMQTSIVSFGYKHGIPLDVDIVFDCRFLPNPYWIETLRPLSGLDPAVHDYLFDQADTTEFLDKVEDLLAMLLPAYATEGKSYLTVAFGCTGGRHRSVALAAALGERLSARGVATSVFHRDVER